MRRLWQLLRPEAFPLAVASGCMLVLALTTALAAALVGPALQMLLLGPASGALPSGSPTFLDGLFLRLLPPWLLTARFGFAVLILAVALVKGLAYFGQFHLMARTGQRVASRLRRDLLAKLLAAPPAFLGAAQTGDLLSRFSNDVTAVEMAVTYALSAYVRDSTTAILLLGVCFFIDWRLSLLACAALPLTLVPLARLLKRLRRRLKGASVSQGALGHLVAEGLQGLPSIQVDGLQARETERFRRVNAAALDHQVASAQVRALLSPLMELAAATGLCAMLLWAATSVAHGTLSGETLTSLLAAVLLLSQPLKALGKVGHFAVAGQVSLGRLDEILGAAFAARRTGVPALPLQRALTLRDLTFRYAPGAPPALDRLNLTVRRGERVALVGESGAGKSTLFQLLLGLRRAETGELFYDDQPLDALDPQSLHRQLAWMGQEPFLFDGTIAQNIALGEEQPDLARLTGVAQRAQALEFIDRAGGFQAPVGERGRRLSGGERQRLCIARALYQGAPLLLLDEPTSHLDSYNEQAVQGAFVELLQDRTVLLIAHRLATVRRCDRAVVLAAGRAVDEGPPEVLLSRPGPFRALFGAAAGSGLDRAS